MSCRALVVDDDADIRFLVRLTLEQSTIEVGEAADGEEALDRWRESRPDVVVLDSRMPGRCGLDIAEVILGEDPDQAIVLFSAWIDRATEHRAWSLGVRECVPKDQVRYLAGRVLVHAAD